jgi:glycine cleavage system H protein
MEEFTRVDIFDTKGTEYLFVIAYLIILIAFWRLIKNPAVISGIKKAISTISAGVLRIPQGIFFNRNHTWAHLSETGEAKVGLDDFIQHITGRVHLTNLKEPGDIIDKGDLLTVIDQGGKQLKVYSPISGKITNTNEVISDDPELINEDPYDQGWLYMIEPKNWRKDTSSFMLADEAVEWSEKEMVRFKDFLMYGAMSKYSPETSMVMLQDGGEIRDNVLSDLPVEVWEEFQQEFLDLH